MIDGVLSGRTVSRPLTVSADVVVVGSGAGGAVVARELARDGRSVLVVEEGGYYAPEEYSAMTPSNTFRRLAREAALGTAVGLGETPLVAVLSGKCVGGSSVLTGGVCFRVPEEVLGTWVTELGLPEMGAASLEPHFRAIEEAVHVETVPDGIRSRSTELFVEGAEKLGIRMKPLRRNTHGCRGEGRCNFGCPRRAKMSVDLSMLPDACAHGARILADALVDHVVIVDGRAVGVRGRFLDGVTGEPGVPFHVSARTVVVACGALHTPLLLRRSGLRSKHLGRHLTLHPSTRVFALFDERLDGWDGAFQSVYSDQFFARDGITLISAFGPANLLAAGFPGIAARHREYVRRLPHTAAFGALIHDEGGGQVRRWLSREPLVTYRMGVTDRGRLLRAIRILAEMALAAGAREVILPLFGAPTIHGRAELDGLLATPPSLRRAECVSFHPLGSARMSAR
ncbi:MAG TPA: GMC family oxidoreductase N-terminal domain-containing protein, partial [Polyangiaceae bacterium]|nr:GMC family oxidoreductase N-terminal domain-containing protein [Polyangiaceae bacterium]